MAHIVPFRIAAARGMEEVEADRTAGAEIVIFPGVRRERHVDPQAAPQTVRSGSDCTRDWLMLPDELQAELPPDQRR